jgi:DNA-binding transcriptional MerR regulator/quercetin dioxygenase-like cupin family protein
LSREIVLRERAQYGHPRAHFDGPLRIGEVARTVGVSPSILRTWENLGLISPRRTPGHYRIYSIADLRILMRAQFLRRNRGLNAPAIVHLLKSEGALSSRRPHHASAVGQRLRRLRSRRGLSLKRVARAVGVSTGFLSALERGHMSASVATLRRLARFFGANILALFEPPKANTHRVRPSDRRILDTGSGVRMELLAWGNPIMEPHLFTVAAGAGSGEAYSHDGEEFLYILRGQLEIGLRGSQEQRLRSGDSFYFESHTPHHWRNPGKSVAQILWINTPPTF